MSNTNGIVRSVAGMLAAACFVGTVSAALPNGVAVGDATQNSAVLWARTDTAGSLTFQYATDSAFTNIVGSAGVVVTDPTIPAKATISGLNPGTQYYYRAIDSTLAQNVGKFVTPRAAGQQGGFNLGVTGDWRGEVGPYSGVRNVASRNPDLFVKLGDTIYADTSSAAHTGQAQTLPQFRAKHNEVQSPLGGVNYWQDVNQSTAVLAMIDDHEVTNDFAGFDIVDNDARFSFGSPAAGTRINKSPLFNNGIQAFHEYMPIAQQTYSNTGLDPRTDGVVDLYRQRTYGKDAAVFMADARSLRDKELPDLALADLTNPVAVANYIGQTYTPGRTMLGNRQFNRLATDLLAAQQSGVTWKFVMIPEPIQNLGVLAASDRFEGYAFERAQLLGFIDQNNIENVVFVSADIHGTLVNNLSYFNGTTQKKVNAFEITTGSVGYDAPFGPTVAGFAQLAGIPGALDINTYLGLPSNLQEAYIKGVIDAQVTPLGYSPLGLEDSGLNYELLQGNWTATNSYGWTEFNVDPITQELLVTTWGVPWYPEGTPAAFINSLQPTILQQFRLAPIPEPTSLAALAAASLALLRRRR